MRETNNNLAAMANGKDNNNQTAILQLGDSAIVAKAVSLVPGIVASHRYSAQSRAIQGGDLDHASRDSVGLLPINFLELLARLSRDLKSPSQARASFAP